MSLLALFLLLALAGVSLGQALLRRDDAAPSGPALRPTLGPVLPPLAGAVLAMLALAAGGDAAALPIPLGASFGFTLVAALDAVGLLAAPALLGAVAAHALIAAGARGRVALLAFGATVLVVGGSGLLLATGLAAIAVAAYGAATETVAIVLLAAGALAPLLAANGVGTDDALALARAAGAAHGAGTIGAALGLGAALLLLLRPPAALPGGGGVTIAAGLLVALRFSFDLDGPVPFAPLGVAMLACGTAALLAGMRRALGAPTLDRVADAFAAAGGGGVAGALGLALLARAADLPRAEAGAIGSAVLLAAAIGAALPLARSAAAALAVEAGTIALDATGGLGRAAPRMSALLGFALLSLALLPGGAGFAPLFLLLDLLLAPQRFGGTGLALGLGIALGANALAAAVGAAALFRAVATALLGRPRSPRAAAGGEPPRARQTVPTVLAVAVLLLALLPGPLLALGAPAFRALAGADLDGQVGWAGLAGSDGGAVWSPLAIGLVAAIACGLFAFGPRRVPTAIVADWDDGAPPPPDWLPFGEPATQLSPESCTAAVLLGDARQAVAGEAAVG